MKGKPRMKCRAGVLAGLSLTMSVGATEFTDEIQRQVDDCAARGGGVVRIPSGTHYTKGVYLRSNVELHLEKGAILFASGTTNDYRRVVLPYSEGAWMAIVMSVGETNVAVTGEGLIDGNGGAFPNPHKGGGGQEGWRPRGMFFGNCRGVRLEGFTLRDAACWGIVFQRSEDIVARHVTISNKANLNNDGFDIEARNVVIEDCDVDAGDDAYCIKSNDPDYIVENIRIRDCVGSTFCNVFKLGTASHGTMRDIRFERCRAVCPRRDFPQPDEKLRRQRLRSRAKYNLSNRSNELAFAISAISVQNVDGGTVEDIVYRDIDVSGAYVPIYVRGGTRTGRDLGTPPSDRYVLRNVLLENITGVWNSQTPSQISGVEGCRVKDVTLRNVHLRGAGSGENAVERLRMVPELAGAYPSAAKYHQPLPAYGLYVRHADNVRLDDVTFELEEGTFDRREKIYLDDATLTCERCAGLVGLDAAPYVWDKVENAKKFEYLNPHFKKAFDFLRREDLATLPIGRYEIDGSNCWAMVQECKLVPLEERPVEAHRNYIDIQAPLSGPEVMGLCRLDGEKRRLPFDEQKDCVLFQAQKQRVEIRPGEFIVFFPPFGGHAPGCSSAESSNILRKVVIKVRNYR